MFKGYKTFDETILFLINVKCFLLQIHSIRVFDSSALLIPTDLGHTCADSNSFCTINCVETIASPKMQTNQKGTLKVKSDCTECQNEDSEYVIEGCRFLN